MTAPAWARQSEYEVRFEWGPAGVEAVAAPFVVIVDVLRFTTAVDAATAQGALVVPSRWKEGGDAAGELLSPVRLSRLRAGDEVTLPSPNGATCADVSSTVPVLTAPGAPFSDHNRSGTSPA